MWVRAICLEGTETWIDLADARIIKPGPEGGTLIENRDGSKITIRETLTELRVRWMTDRARLR